jgi:hypothetical protein
MSTTPSIRGNDRMVVGFTTTCATVPSTTKVVSSNHVHGEVYSIQHYVIKLVIDLRQVGGFPRYIVESGVKHHKPTNLPLAYSIGATDHHSL